MGFLKTLRNVLQDDPVLPEESSFHGLSKMQLARHCARRKYGDFFLTDAIRPAYKPSILPRQGYRHDIYEDDESHAEVPVLMAAASREVLSELFLDLIRPLGSTVDVVLETSHHGENGDHRDLYREHIDMPVLQSILPDYEDLLLNDGCTGIAVLNPSLPQEVQFDEHKVLIVYGPPLTSYEALLEAHGVKCDEEIRFITEAEHIHASADECVEQFEQLATTLGMDE